MRPVPLQRLLRIDHTRKGYEVYFGYKYLKTFRTKAAADVYCFNSATEDITDGAYGEGILNEWRNGELNKFVAGINVN